VVSPNDDRGFKLSGANHFIEGESGEVALTEPEPADSGGETLECDSLASLVEPAMERYVLGE
jgi:hypothetical protein